MRYLVFLVIFLQFWAGPAWAANDHGLNPPDEQEARDRDAHDPYIVSGCLPSAFSVLTITAFACDGYAVNGQELVFIRQLTVPITLPAVDGPHWLLLFEDTFTNPAGWSAAGFGTHFRQQQAASEPADPAGGLGFAQVVVDGGAITLVTPYAYRSPEAARFQRYHVNNWGCLGDNSFDNATCLNQAFDAATLLPRGPGGTEGAGRVHVGIGVYRFFSQIRILSRLGSYNLHITGDGQGSILESHTSATEAFFINFGTTPVSAVLGFRMSDLWIRGGTGDTSGTLVRADRLVDARWTNIIVSNGFGDGFTCGRCENSVFIAPHFKENGGNGFHAAVNLGGIQGSNIKIIGCTVKDNDDSGLWLETGNEHKIIGCQIETNSLDGGANEAGILIESDRIELIGNSFEGPAGLTTHIQLGIAGAASADSVEIDGGNCNFGVVKLVRYTNLHFSDFNFQANCSIEIEDEHQNRTSYLENILIPLANVTNNTTIAGKISFQRFSDGSATDERGTFADGDTTPSVRGTPIWFTANTSATTITQFDEGTVGQTLVIVATDALTTLTDGTFIFTGTGANVTLADGDIYIFEGKVGESSTSVTTWVPVGFLAATEQMGVGAGTFTILSASASSASTTGWVQLGPSVWVPFTDNPAP